jgi:hypothetical protein
MKLSVRSILLGMTSLIGCALAVSGCGGSDQTPTTPTATLTYASVANIYVLTAITPPGESTTTCPGTATFANSDTEPCTGNDTIQFETNGQYVSNIGYGSGTYTISGDQLTLHYTNNGAQTIVVTFQQSGDIYTVTLVSSTDSSVTPYIGQSGIFEIVSV